MESQDSDLQQKQESSNLMDNQSEPMYDSSNLWGEDDYIANLGPYDGYESNNDSGGTTEEDDRYDSSHASTGYQQNSKAAVLQKKNFRFMNGKDGKDGMATCEQCGSIGVRHAFYSKSKRFCSLSCSRSFATAQREGKSLDSSLGPPPTKKSKHSGGGRKSKGQSNQKSNNKQEVKEFDWGTYLVSNLAPAAPVSCFSHVPMSESWDQIGVGLKVEVTNKDTDVPYPCFWIASVIRVAGFTALVRYEGFGTDSTHDFWVSLVSPNVHPVGWCATIGKPLVPPQSIQNRYSDWKEFLVKRLTGSRTLPENFFQLFQECMDNQKFRRGMKVEVVNKVCVSSMKVAVICDVVGGRLRLNYLDSKDEGDEFWCHMKSPLIHYVGWSLSVGHSLDASQEYRNACLSKVATGKYTENDVSPDMMVKMKDPPQNMSFSVGMKLEAIDPLNLSAICVATVMKVLRNNYLMIGIDGSPMVAAGSDWFCYHSTSACIFPVGFCEINNIDLTPPRGHKGAFKWFDYLKQTKSIAAPVKLFDKEIPKHGYRPGMKIEAVDLMEPRLICVATVTRIVGRLLRIHFDGWENEYDQWVDCQSPDIYPVGWCQAMKYTLEGPRIKENVAPVPLMHKKKKTKNQIYKGPRKKRKSKPGLTGNPFPQSYRFLSSSLVDSGDKPAVAPTVAAKDTVVRPPHVPLPPEAVAANLRPLLETDLPEPGKKTKEEPSDTSPMETSTTPASHSHPQAIDTLPTLTPKGGHVADQKSASSQLGQSVKVECGQGTASGSSSSSPHSGASGAATADSLNNNTSSNNNATLNSHGQASSVANAQQTNTSVASLSFSLGSTNGNANEGSSSSSALSFTPSLQNKPPNTWSAQDVCLFLSVNDCAACSEAVLRRNIGGDELLSLSAEEEISLAGTKVGPSLRITQLLQQLRSYVSTQPSSASASTAPAAMETD